MAIKTENLAIVLTDMAGYTEATVQQSRVEIEQLLATHNRILLPIVRRFKGRHIKSIGDALLLVFRSPTDAMLCAMAMQDALYEYNRSVPKERQIHMRVGASLGEVRVARGDIFGEPVNLTSRICSATPADEIYLSEALFMAMNKAEVPSQEVGWRELKGIPQPVRIYHIPRFAVPRLVPDVMAAEDMTDLVYPYGGAHLAGEHASNTVGASMRRFGQGIGHAFGKRPVQIALGLIVLVPLALIAARQAGLRTPAVKPAPVAETPLPEATPSPVAKVDDAPNAPQQSSPAPADTANLAPAPRPAPPPPKPVARPAPVAPAAPPVASEPPKPQYASITEAKKAYKAKQISKDEYKRTVRRIDAQMDREIDQAKRDYKARKLTKAEYRQRVKEIEKQYE